MASVAPPSAWLCWTPWSAKPDDCCVGAKLADCCSPTHHSPTHHVNCGPPHQVDCCVTTDWNLLTLVLPYILLFTCLGFIQVATMFHHFMCENALYHPLWIWFKEHWPASFGPLYWLCLSLGVGYVSFRKPPDLGKYRGWKRSLVRDSIKAQRRAPPLHRVFRPRPSQRPAFHGTSPRRMSGREGRKHNKSRHFQQRRLATALLSTLPDFRVINAGCAPGTWNMMERSTVAMISRMDAQFFPSEPKFVPHKTSKPAGVHTKPVGVRTAMMSPCQFRSSMGPESTFKVVWDSGATQSVSPCRDDFVGPIQKMKNKVKMDGIANGLVVKGVGHVAWSFEDTSGMLRTLKLPAYYVPKIPVRLLSTKSMLQAYPNEEIRLVPGSLTVSGAQTSEQQDVR